MSRCTDCLNVGKKNRLNKNNRCVDCFCEHQLQIEMKKFRCKYCFNRDGVPDEFLFYILCKWCEKGQTNPLCCTLIFTLDHYSQITDVFPPKINKQLRKNAYLC